MNKTVTASEARNDFFKILKLIQTPGVAVTITFEGHPAGVLMSAEEFAGWEETMDIMADPEEAREIEAALRAKDTEEKVPFDRVKADLGL